MVSAAMPAALVAGVRVREPEPGEKILLLGFGSGLNTAFTGIQW
jgi:3-oxoacyl-[acyl-carrier-protein] synthase III